MIWNPFNKPPKNIDRENQIPVENRTEKETVFVSLEYDLARASVSDKSLGSLLDNLSSRIENGTRSKVVLFCEVSRDQYYNGLLSKKPKGYFDKVLKEKIAKKEKVLVERYSGSLPDILEQNEYHEVLEQIKNIDAEKYAWIFVYNNSEEEMLNPGNLKGIFKEF